MRLELHAEVSPDGRALTARYVARNDSEVETFLLHLQPGAGSEGYRPHAHVYHRGGAAVLLFTGTPPPPPGMMLTWPGTPGATRLAPGESTEAELVLGVPLLERNNVTAADAEAPAEPVAVTEVWLRVAHVAAGRGLEASPHPSFPGVYRVSGLPALETEATCRLALPCPMLRRKGAFHRIA